MVTFTWWSLQISLFLYILQLGTLVLKTERWLYPYFSCSIFSVCYILCPSTSAISYYAFTGFFLSLITVSVASFLYNNLSNLLPSNQSNVTSDSRYHILSTSLLQQLVHKIPSSVAGRRRREPQGGNTRGAQNFGCLSTPLKNSLNHVKRVSPCILVMCSSSAVVSFVDLMPLWLTFTCMYLPSIPDFPGISWPSSQIPDRILREILKTWVSSLELHVNGMVVRWQLVYTIIKS